MEEAPENRKTGTEVIPEPPRGPPAGELTDPGDGLQVRQVDRVATARGAREKEDMFLDVRGKEPAPWQVASTCWSRSPAAQERRPAMNTEGLAKLYDTLTPRERLPLIIAAAARG